MFPPPKPAAEKGVPPKYCKIERILVIYSIKTNFPIDPGRKPNVHITFRRRQGRLLNVLCTFNLRPLPTGL